MTSTALINKQSIIDQVSSGLYLSDIAKSLGVSSAAISKQLSTDPEYKLAREIGLDVRLNQAMRKVEEIADLGVDKDSGEIVGLPNELVNLARVRESSLKAAQWQAERECPKRWGKDQSLVQSSFGAQGITINIGSVTPPGHTVAGSAKVVDEGGECVDDNE